VVRGVCGGPFGEGPETVSRNVDDLASGDVASAPTSRKTAEGGPGSSAGRSAGPLESGRARSGTTARPPAAFVHRAPGDPTREELARRHARDAWVRAGHDWRSLKEGLTLRSQLGYHRAKPNSDEYPLHRLVDHQVSGVDGESVARRLTDVDRDAARAGAALSQPGPHSRRRNSSCLRSLTPRERHGATHRASFCLWFRRRGRSTRSWAAPTGTTALPRTQRGRGQWRRKLADTPGA